MPSALSCLAMRESPSPSAAMRKIRRTISACSSATLRRAAPFTPGSRSFL